MLRAVAKVMCDGLAGCRREGAAQPPSQAGCALAFPEATWLAGQPVLPGNSIVPWHRELCVLWGLRRTKEQLGVRVRRLLASSVLPSTGLK